MIDLFLCVDSEGGRFLGVKRTKPYVILAPLSEVHAG
jgi:hypothetical protein